MVVIGPMHGEFQLLVSSRVADLCKFPGEMSVIYLFTRYKFNW